MGKFLSKSTNINFIIKIIIIILLSFMLLLFIFLINIINHFYEVLKKSVPGEETRIQDLSTPTIITHNYQTIAID